MNRATIVAELRADLDSRDSALWVDYLDTIIPQGLDGEAYWNAIGLAWDALLAEATS